MNIAFYRDQIRQATNDMESLPDDVYGWDAQRQVENERRALLRDIRHYERLIEIAERGTD